MKYFILMIMLISIPACREEILEPYNPAGNVNQPIQEKKLNYLNLVMTTSNLTYEFETEVEFNSSDTKIFISIVDCEKGKITINVISGNNLIFVTSIETETINIVEKIRGKIPDKIRVSFNNFSGKLLLQLSKADQ
ncbi:hypothetical protein [Ignavibacterium album]|uniref:hypothetical protein n=1 Tax=Ignavibacterium album TaxID=591197 RepID=UPI0026F348B1|nr:hypothetical protein [Ignavibacterium album]